MLTNFFSKTKPSTIIVILLLFLSYYGLAVINGVESILNLKVVPLFFLTLALVTFIDIKNNLSFDNTYVLLFFTVLVGVFPYTLTINSSFYANVTLLLFLRKVYSLQSPKNTFKKLFDAGFWLGITFIIEPFSILFFLMLYISVIIHHRLSVQGILLPLLGFFVPVFLFFTYCFWYDNLDPFYNLLSWYSYYDISQYEGINYLTGFVFTAVFTFIAMFLKTPKALSVLNDFRRSWILVLINFFCALFLVILINNKNGSELLYLLFPTAIIIANGLELYEKKWFVDIITITFLIFPLVLLFV